MNTYKLWKPTPVSLSQEPDRQRRKHFSSSSHHKNPDARTAGKDDARLRSGRGYVSDGPPPSSQTLAPSHPPPAAPSLATASRASHLHTSTQASQGHPAHMSQKTPLPASSPPQDAHPSPADRYLDPTHDSRVTSQRVATATDKKPFISSDPVRPSGDHHHKSSRHRSRTIPPAALESTERPAASTSAWPLPSSFLKKDGGEKDRDPSRTRAKDEPKPTSKSKERRRTEKTQEQASRDQREQSTRYEEERQRYKEERRREKDRRREEEQRRDESHREQKVKEDQIQKATRYQERRPEVKDNSVPLLFLGKDPRLGRVKDSDESDNSLMKPGSIRPKRRRQRDHPTAVPAVPSVLRQSAYLNTSAPVPISQTENGPSNLNESRQTPTLAQPSNVTPGTTNEKYSAKPHKGSPSQNLTVPYPPGYAVSASDGEHVTKREHRSKPVENGRSIERPRTSGGHRTSVAHEAVHKPPAMSHAQPPIDRSSQKAEKQSKGGFGGWLFHRDGTSSYPKSADVHATNQNATQATARVAPPPNMHNDTPEHIPRVVSIRAGEGPADYLQETNARRPTPPTVTPSARDVTVQPLPTVQVLQQPQTVDRQPRAVPRVAASVQLDPPSHASAVQLTSPRPWLQSAQWSTEPQPMSPVPQPMSAALHPMSPAPQPMSVALHPISPAPQPMSAALHPMSPAPQPMSSALHPMSPAPQPMSSALHPMSPAPQPMLSALHPMSPALHPMSPALHPMSPSPRPPVVPSPMVFSVPLSPPSAVVETHRQTMPARSHHAPPMQESPNPTQMSQEMPWPNVMTNSRPPVPSHSVPLPAATNGQRVSPAIVETHRQTMPARSHHAPPTQESPNPIQVLQDMPWPNAATNSRPLAPTVPSHSVPLPAATNGQRVSPSAVVETHRQTMPARSHHAPPMQESPNPIQVPQEMPWPNAATNSRPLAPTVPSHSVPLPVSTNGQRVSPSAVVETHRQTMPARSHHAPPMQESPKPTQVPQDMPWPNTATNSRPLAPTAPSHSVPLPATTNGRRVSPQGATFAVPDVVSTKPSRQRSTPGGYGDSPPVHGTPPPSRPIAPDLAAAFPIREDNVEAYHRYLTQEERAQETRASRNIPDQWDRHGHIQESAMRIVVSNVPSSERTPRSTKTSPNLHPRPVNQVTPPKSPLPPILPSSYQPQASTHLDLPQAHNTSQPGVYNVLPQNLNSSAYPATSIYPSSSLRPHVEASPVINDPSVANAPSNNPSPKVKPGNPSPRSRSQVVAPSQPGPTHPVAVHVTNRTPSHETGSTTLLGQTPSSQGSMLLVPMSPMPQQQVIVPRSGNYNGQQSVHPPAPVPDNLGDRNTQATTQTLSTPATRQTVARHQHSASAPTIPVSAVSQPPPVRSQTQPAPKVLAPVSPMPVRSYSTAQTLGDPYATRYPVSGYPSTPVPNARQLRATIPSPSEESELNTPSSLAISTKLPIVSDEPLAPVMSSQSYQEPKKKSGFFQGLFRSRSSAQKRHPHESKMVDTSSRAQLPPVRLAPSNTPVPLQYESDSKVGVAPSKLRKARASAAMHPPASTSVPQPPMSQPQPPPTPMAPPPTPLARFEERLSTAPNAFASFRIVTPKRHRTMSGLSAEAVDGTNAGASTVLTSPANSTRSPTPKLIPPQRDPQQATFAWRNKEEAETRQRGKARRRRPGVHFEGYEDHPQAERHKVNYAIRARDREKVRS